MKILHILSTLQLGGAESFVINLANEQANEHEVTILTYKPFDDRKSYENSLNAKISRIKLYCTKKYSLKLAWDLYKKVKQNKPDVVHFHLHSSLYHIFLASILYKKPVYVHTIHSELFFWRKTFHFLTKISFLHNRIRHICISPKIYDQFKTLFPKLHFYSVSNGIAPYRLKRSSENIKNEINQLGIRENNRFLMIANLSKVKNLAMAAQVFKMLENNNMDASLLIIGEDRDKDLEVTKEIEAIGAGNVFLLGPKQSAPDFLTECDALIISSLNEGMPIVALEALSVGKPILSTPAGGMTDIVQNGYNGYITSAFSAADLFTIVNKFILLSDEDKRKMTENAQFTFNTNYTISKIAKDYEKVYQFQF